MMESDNVEMLNRKNISQSSSEVSHIMAKLTRNKEKRSPVKKTPRILKRVVSPEIEKLTGQLQSALGPASVSRQSWVTITGPGLGLP